MSIFSKAIKCLAIGTMASALYNTNIDTSKFSTVENLPQVVSFGSKPAIAGWCPQIKREEKTEDGGIYYIYHMNACGQVYYYMNRQSMYKFREQAQNTAAIFGTGMLASIASGVGAGAGVWTGYQTIVNSLTANNINTCLDRGANSVWLSSYAAGHYITVTCGW